MTNRKSTKRALLASVMALLLCFSMLLSMTFAWFTDSAASGSNVITAGNLDIVVEYTLDGENWNELDGATDLFQKGLWEPGHTEVVALKITNAGSLALKYAANMNIASETIGKTKDGADIVLSDILTVSTLVQQANDDIGVGDIALMLAFNGESSVAYENTATFKAGNILRSDVELAPGVEHYLIIKVDMDEAVANEANHNGTDIPTINFGINVLATQFTYENDSFGNQYDADAEYPVIDAAGLSDALAEGKSVKFEADISLTETIAVADNVTIDLNGFDMDASALDSAFFVASGSDVTVKIEGTDEEVKLGKNGLVDVAAGANATIEINGGSFISDDAGSTLIKPDGDGEIKIVLNDVNYTSTAANGYVLDCSYYDGSNLSVEINGGTFEATTGLLLPEGSSVKDATITAKNTKNMQPAVYAMGDMTIENCIIKAEKSHAVAVAGGATLTINNCEVYAGSDANALAFQVFSSGGTINVNNTTYNGSYGTTGKMNSGCVAIINIDGIEVYRKG